MKTRIKTWFKNLNRGVRIAIITVLVMGLGVGAYAAVNSLVWDSAHENIAPVKDNYVTVIISGTSAGGSIRPGGSLSLAPTITNNGSVDASAFIKVVMPAVSSAAAYEFSASSDWTKVDESVDGSTATQIWAYGGDELTTVETDGSTSSLTSSFTMKSGITGSQFKDMSSVDIDIYGYLVDKTAGTDPETVWNMIPAE